MTSWKPAQSFFQKEIRGNLILLNPHDIVRIPECQPRVDGTDKKLVDDYAQDMRDYDAFYADHDPPIQGWQKFPRISCVHDPKVGYILFSGNHRLEAILQVGYAEIEIHYFTGTRQDAIVVSKKENASNGKRRTNADKAHVVKSCLLDPELKLWSDQTIAKWCGVSPSTVKNYENSLSNLESENGELYTRPTRRKRLSKSGEIEWIETASIGNGNPEKPNRKELKRKHHSAVVNVQSAFFTADLHEHESFSHLPNVEIGRKAQEFFKRTVAVKVRDMRPNIFATNSEQDFLNETGKALTNAEIEAEIEVLEKIAGQIRWYGKSEEHHLGWIERVLEMEPEQQELETQETEPEQQKTEQPSQTAEEREANKELKQKKQAAKLLWDTRIQVARDYTGDADSDLNQHLTLPELEKAFAENNPSYDSNFNLAMKLTSEQSFNIMWNKIVVAGITLEGLQEQVRAMQTYLGEIKYWQRPNNNWILPLIEAKKAKADKAVESPDRKAFNLALNNAQNRLAWMWDTFENSDYLSGVSRETFAVAASKELNCYEEDQYSSGENYLLEKDYALLKNLTTAELKKWRKRFDEIEDAINAKADWVTALETTEEETDEVANAAEPTEAEDSPTLDDRMDRLRSDLLNNHWLHQYSWEGLDILPFVQEYDIGAGMIDVIQKEIAAEYPKSDTPDEASQNGSNYRLEFLSIGLRDADDNPVKPVKFQLIASRELHEHPLSEVPDALRAELLKLVERLK